MDDFRKTEMTRTAEVLAALRLDAFLFSAILLLMAIGLVTMYSASGQSDARVISQVIRFAVAILTMVAVAQLGVHRLYTWTPFIYLAGLILLVLVFLIGDSGKGAQRWLDLGFMRFQPSEIMKLATPMMVAFYFSERRLPPTFQEILTSCLLVAVPVALIFVQPDLGTSILVAFSGVVVIFVAGIRWRSIIITVIAAMATVPLLWQIMEEYQRRRVISFIDPESDPLGAGYHVIQSKIAIGSGGIHGKGWLDGTQAQLQFLPEQTTDFIFAVFGEEFGLMGVLGLFLLFVFVVFRGLHIAWCAQDSYTRLLAASLSMTFFIYFFVNVGMVSGLMPVVGVPLPLVSYGGTSMVTLLAGFGILSAIQSERRLLTK